MTASQELVSGSAEGELLRNWRSDDVRELTASSSAVPARI